MVCNYSQRHPSDFMRRPSYSNIHPAGCLEGRGKKKKDFSCFGYMFVQAVPLLWCAQNPTKMPGLGKTASTPLRGAPCVICTAAGTNGHSCLHKSPSYAAAER